VLAGPQRTRLYAVKQFFGSVAAFGGGFVIAGLFKPGALAFPDNFALSLGIGFVGLAVASIGFYGIREPMSPAPVRQPQGFLAYVRQVPGIIRADKTFRRFILIENLASFSVMALPFYMLYAKESFDSASEYLGPYLLVQVTGTVLSSFVWGRVAARAAARVIVRSCIFMGAAIPLVALVLIRTNPVLYGIVFFLVGFIISGRRIGFEPYLLDIAPEENRTEYLGIRGSLNILAVILPFAGGLLISRFGYGPTFALVSAIMVLAGILAKNQAEPTVLP
jgi:Na+/melibiose symporter-like transporter